MMTFDEIDAARAVDELITDHANGAHNVVADGCPACEIVDEEPSRPTLGQQEALANIARIGHPATAPVRADAGYVADNLIAYGWVDYSASTGEWHLTAAGAEILRAAAAR